jgi:hypothetical protein
MRMHALSLWPERLPSLVVGLDEIIAANRAIAVAMHKPGLRTIRFAIPPRTSAPSGGASNGPLNDLGTPLGLIGYFQW